MHSPLGSRLTWFALAAMLVSLSGVPSASAAHVADGVDAKVTDDNNNIDGGVENTTPSKDASNRQANETSISISPMASPATGAVGDIVAASANDYRMVPHFGDAWMPVYLSFDGGSTWFGAPPFPDGYNTMVPGFPTDTSAAGLSSPLKNLDGSGDPVVRFDAAGNLYVAGIAFNRDFDQEDKPVDNVVYVAKFAYTPGSAATASTTTSAGLPPHFTFAGTTIVDRGAVGFSVPPQQPFAFAGTFVDKEWMEVDANPASPCAGNVYVTHTAFHGVAGNFPIVFSRSTDSAASFSQPRIISSGGQAGTRGNQGSDIAVAPDGTIYVAYRTFPGGSDTSSTISIVKSTDCGKHWSNPVTVGAITSAQAPGVAFRTPTFAFVAVDDTNPDVVYVAYMSIVGDFDIYVQRSTDAGVTWGAAVQVNTDPGARHQIWPTIDVTNGALHVAWYDFRNSVTADNEALDVFYACTNCDGVAYPVFSHEQRVTDVSHNGNCQMFGGGSVAFHGDYIELDARWDGANHVVHVAWADNRDVPAGECDLTPGPGDTNSVGNRNQNIYTDRLVISP